MANSTACRDGGVINGFFDANVRLTTQSHELVPLSKKLPGISNFLTLPKDIIIYNIHTQEPCELCMLYHRWISTSLPLLKDQGTSWKIRQNKLRARGCEEEF